MRIESAEIDKVDRPVNKPDRTVAQRRVGPVNAADTRFDFGSQILIFLHTFTRRHANEDEFNGVAILQLRKTTLDGFDPMQDSLRVIHAFDGKDDSLVAIG